MAAVPVIPGITHTVFVNNVGTIDPSCVGIVDVPGASLLGLRQMDPSSRITSLNGRTNGTNLDLSRFSFFSYQMRRKAEALQYRKNQITLTKKQQYAQISKTGSGSYYYSSLDLTQKQNLSLNCPNLDVIVRPPTNSGVNDIKYPGYYYDVSVPYLPSL